MKQERLKILVVEDDADDQFFIKCGIHAVNAELEIIPVYNGDQAINYLLRKGNYYDSWRGQPDLIITDLNMPKCTGTDLLTYLQNNTEFKNIPVYVLSTTSREIIKNNCLKLGARKFFTKPNFSSDYVQIIKEMLAESSLGT